MVKPLSPWPRVERPISDGRGMPVPLPDPPDGLVIHSPSVQLAFARMVDHRSLWRRVLSWFRPTSGYEQDLRAQIDELILERQALRDFVVLLNEENAELLRKLEFAWKSVGMRRPIEMPIAGPGVKVSR